MDQGQSEHTVVRLAVLLLLCFICNYSAVGPHAGHAAGVPIHPSDKTPPAPKTAINTDIEFPDVDDWVIYCDKQKKRFRADLGALRERLLEQGFFEIDQLTGDRVLCSDLASCLNIGMGRAGLIIRYAEEDVASVRAGTFTLNPALGPE